MIATTMVTPLSMSLHRVTAIIARQRTSFHVHKDALCMCILQSARNCEIFFHNLWLCLMHSKSLENSSIRFKFCLLSKSGANHVFYHVDFTQLCQ